MLNLLRRPKRCFFCGQGKELKTIEVHYYEWSKTYRFHHECLRSALQPNNDKVFHAMGIVRTIRWRNEDRIRKNKKVAEALKYLEGRYDA